MRHAIPARLVLLTILALMVAGYAPAQDNAEEVPPELPPLEDVESSADYVYDPVTESYVRRSLPEPSEYVPLDLNFRIGVVGEYVKEIMTAGGPQAQIKNPLILIDPRNGEISVYAKNFPARILADSPNGSWIVGVAASSSVEGSSGSHRRECAVSLAMDEGTINIIREFPLFCSVQAFFSPRDANVIYYSVNEPGPVNSIIQYNLKTKDEIHMPAEGNRFRMYGLRPLEPRGIWIADPMSVAQYPVLSLLSLDDASQLARVEFPGASEVLASPDGDALLAVVSSSAESSLGYYMHADSSFHQVPGLVLTRPTAKWVHSSSAVIVKESTATRDRFLWIDLETGDVRELWSDYFKISFWDISPEDDALVFLIDSDSDPLLYVLPLDTSQGALNRIRLKDVSNVSWLGCLNPPRSGGWLDRLLPF